MAAKTPRARKATAKRAAKKATARTATAKRAPRKPAAREASAPAKKPAPPRAPAKKAAKKAAARKPAFGRPGTAGKADGDDAVRAWIAGVKREQRPIVERLDALIAEEVPGVKRAVKWSMPIYGRAGHGWFAHLGSFKDYVALAFTEGARLVPPPPVGESERMRRVWIHDMSELDEARIRDWIRQAAALEGWSRV